MSRQTRRSTTVADAADASQMDPWKDDRCRDFLALNTIQRLRSYHMETLLPVEPVNSVRARNLVMLPKPEPLEKTCETDAGCAIDTARILFFGPMSFLSPTSQGRTTASPHGGGGGGHSGSHASCGPCDDTVAKANAGLSPMHPPTDPNAKGTDIAHIIDAGATPLRLNPNDGKETALASSPHPRCHPDANSAGDHREGNTMSVIANSNGHGDEGDAEHATRSGGGGDVAMSSSGTPAAETQRFSCAIVEALTAYYQSLLSRGVVLDRFNAKDLAFAWWVVGRNMDVSALSRHTGPMRRDALLMLVRHFYYELLTDQRMNKELAVKEVSTEEDVHAEVEKPNNNNNNNNISSSSSNDNNNNNPDEEEDAEATQKGPRNVAEGTSVKHTTAAKVTGNNNDDNNKNDNSSTSVNARKRTRSRLDPTRTSTSTASNRLRRPPTEKPLQEPPPPLPTAGEAIDPVKPPDVPAEAETEGKQDTEPAPPPEEGKVPEKSSRPPRGANIEEVWRPLRSTRRRQPTPEDSIDFATAAAATAAKARADPLEQVVERIRRRVAQDSVYAALATGFPSDRGRPAMHSALLRLLRYVRRAATETDDAAPAVASEGPIDLKREEEEEEEEEEEAVEEGGREGSSWEEGKKEEQEQQKERQREQQVDWEGYVQHVAAQLAEAKSRRHSNGRRKVAKSSESTEGDGSSEEDDDDDGADEGEEDEEVNTDEESDDDDFTAPVVRPPCPFSALTYAQQCLLTWEASDILDPRYSAAAVRRRKRERDRKNKRRLRQRQRQGQHMSPDEVAGECAGTHRPPRKFYDYWKNL